LDLQVKIAANTGGRGNITALVRSKSRRTNVRFIAATNRDVEKRIRSRDFFAKISFYRPLGLHHLPAALARKGKDDIPLLAKYFITQFSLKTKQKRAQRFSDTFIKNIAEKHTWKGNIRELKNVIERCIILADDDLNVSLLPSDFESD